MPIIHLIVVLVVIGVCLWMVNIYVPMDPKIKTIINVVVVLALCIWLLNAFGLLSGSGLRVCSTSSLRISANP